MVFNSLSDLVHFWPNSAFQSKSECWALDDLKDLHWEQTSHTSGQRSHWESHSAPSCLHYWSYTPQRYVAAPPPLAIYKKMNVFCFNSISYQNIVDWIPWRCHFLSESCIISNFLYADLVRKYLKKVCKKLIWNQNCLFPFLV